jgi:hypothetical protein
LVKYNGKIDSLYLSIPQVHRKWRPWLIIGYAIIFALGWRIGVVWGGGV